MTHAAPIFTRVNKVPSVYGIGKSTLYRWAERGDVTIHRRGGCSFVRDAEMVELITVGKEITHAGRGWPPSRVPHQLSHMGPGHRPQQLRSG